MILCWSMVLDLILMDIEVNTISKSRNCGSTVCIVNDGVGGGIGMINCRRLICLRIGLVPLVCSGCSLV